MRAALATAAQRASLGTVPEVWNFFAEGSGQIDLVVLLLHEDVANLFRHRVFSKRLTLPDPIAVIANGLVFVIEIVLERVFGFVDVRIGSGLTTAFCISFQEVEMNRRHPSRPRAPPATLRRCEKSDGTKPIALNTGPIRGGCFPNQSMADVSRR